VSKFDNFITLVSAEATFACLSRNKQGMRPSAIISVALQIPGHVLFEDPEKLRRQAEELTDWFYGGKDPSWLPEHLLYEEVEEEVEEFVPRRHVQEEEYEYVEPEETYYEQ
jgi:hypothetical protein